MVRHPPIDRRRSIDRPIPPSALDRARHRDCARLPHRRVRLARSPMSYLATTRILFRPEHSVASAPAKPWLWPLPRLDGASPGIVSPADRARADGLVELGYADRASCKELVPVFAPTDGVVTYAAHSDGGG